jgi:hypothetical protein
MRSQPSGDADHAWLPPSGGRKRLPLISAPATSFRLTASAKATASLAEALRAEAEAGSHGWINSQVFTRKELQA